MRAALTEDDIKGLKYSCRPGIIIPFLLFVIGSSLMLGYFYINLPYLGFPFSIMQTVIFSEIIFFIICVFISYILIGKYVSDIINKEKEIEFKVVMLKECKEDYEAGSGTVGSLGTEMASFTNCSIIVDNTRYRVDEDFYKSVKVGDEVCFHYGPISRDLIRIELKRMPSKGTTPINLFN